MLAAPWVESTMKSVMTTRSRRRRETSRRSKGIHTINHLQKYLRVILYGINLGVSGYVFQKLRPLRELAKLTYSSALRLWWVDYLGVSETAIFKASFMNFKIITIFLDV